MNHRATQSLRISHFLYASNTIVQKLKFKYLGLEIGHVSPLAQGYGIISHPHTCTSLELYFRLSTLIQNHKTVVLENVDREVMELLSQLYFDYPNLRLVDVVDGEPFEITPDYYKNFHHFESSTIFVLSEQFLLRNFLHQRSQKRNLLFHHQETLPVQCVRFIGLGPSQEMLTEHAMASIYHSSHIVLFDRTLENIVKNVNFPGHKYVLHYMYEDFALNLLALNLMLATLQANGVYDVSVLIEGNPEIYDFAEGLSTVRREFIYEASVPLVVVGCQWLEEQYGLSFIEPGYILTSGYNSRQGITTYELLQELTSYLETDLTFMVMEMYCGDIPLVLSQLQRTERRKSIVILTNMFSPQQHIYFLPSHQAYQADWVEEIKGKFTTLVVIDNQRLRIDSQEYAHLIDTFSPHFCKN